MSAEGDTIRRYLDGFVDGRDIHDFPTFDETTAALDALEARCERLERILYPGPVFACIVDESAGLREGADMSGVISDAADKLTEVSNKIASIDLSDEREKISEILGAAAATLGEIEASLRGFVQQVGEPQSVPQAGEVSNPAEPFPGAETTPEDAEPADESAE